MIAMSGYILRHPKNPSCRFLHTFRTGRSLIFSTAVKSALLPFNPQFRPFPVKHLTT